MLISVHLPKTAGSSFLKAMEAHFSDSLYRDYGDRPVNKGSLRRNVMAIQSCLLNALPRPSFRDVRCIHGHFMPLKYRLLSSGVGEKRYVVWMRDPVERLASHYHYWQRSFNLHDAGDLHRQVIEENWSFERFCLGPELQNIYSKFFWGFPLDSFDFIGITEFYESDVVQFSREFLGVQLDAERTNVNPRENDGVYVDDQEFRERVEKHHSEDMMLYRRALEMRETRRELAALELIS